MCINTAAFAADDGVELSVTASELSSDGSVTVDISIIKNPGLDNMGFTVQLEGFSLQSYEMYELSGTESDLINDVTTDRNLPTTDAFPISVVTRSVGTDTDATGHLIQLKYQKSDDASYGYKTVSFNFEGIYGAANSNSDLLEIDAGSPVSVLLPNPDYIKSIDSISGTIYKLGNDLTYSSDFAVHATNYSGQDVVLDSSKYSVTASEVGATITLTENYYGVAPTYDVVTATKAATSISLNPTTVSVTVGDSKETVASKVKYTAIYNDGTTSEEKQVTADMLGDFDLSSAGQKTVIVTAEGQTAELTVDVAEHKHMPGAVQGVNQDPTCTEPGSMQYWVCNICHQKFSDEACTQPIETEIIPALGHQLVKHDEVAATCTTTGTKEYWECTRDTCGNLFSDAEGHNVIDEPETIEALGHALEKHEEVPATCTEAGTKAYWECTRCGKLFSDEAGNSAIEAPESIAALGHHMTHHEAVASTCQTHGTIEYWSCDRCQKNFKDNQGLEIADSLEAPLAAHKLSPTEAKDPTATEDGNIAYWTCSVCNKTFSDENGTTEVVEVVIPALGEQIAEVIQEESIQLTVEDVTEEAAVASLTEQFNKALRSICEGYTATVNVAEGGYVAPVAGTAENPKGTPGSITYTVTITKDDNAADTTTTNPQTLAIAAKEYVAPSAPTYTITVNGAYADKKTAKAGETVTVTAPYKFGYTFAGWKTSSNLTLANRSPISFIMPDGNVTIEPVYTYTPVYYPPVDYYPPVISKPETKPEKVEDGWHGDQYYQDGEPVVGWLEVTHGQWYYFDRSGSMMTGWVKVDGTWYYMLDPGVMATGWVKVNGSWYFLKNSGAMATGWLWDNGHWYYLSGSGAMKTGWVLSGSKWYYLNAGGAMVTGWVEWKGDWYYMNTPNGDMAVDTKTPDGYYVNSDGIWVK